MISEVSMHIVDRDTRDVYANIFLSRSASPLIAPFPNQGDVVYTTKGGYVSVIKRVFEITEERYALTLYVERVDISDTYRPV